MAENNEKEQDFMTMWKNKKEQEMKSSMEVLNREKSSMPNEPVQAKDLVKPKSPSSNDKDFMTFFKDKKAKDDKGTAIGELIERAEKAEAKQKELEKRNEELTEKIKSNVDFIEKAEKIINTTAAEEQNLKSELKTIKDENENLSTELAKKTEILKEFETKMKEISIKIKIFSTKIDELTSENRVLKEMIKNKENEIAGTEDGALLIQLREKINEFKRVIEEKDKLINSLMNLK